MKLLFSVATALLGMIGVSSAVIGYFIRHSRVWERSVLFGAGLMLIISEVLSSGIGLGLIILIWFIQKKRPDEGSGAKALVI